MTDWIAPGAGATVGEILEAGAGLHYIPKKLWAKAVTRKDVKTDLYLQPPYDRVTDTRRMRAALEKACS